MMSQNYTQNLRRAGLLRHKLLPSNTAIFDVCNEHFNQVHTKTNNNDTTLMVKTFELKFGDSYDFARTLVDQ